MVLIHLFRMAFRHFVIMLRRGRASVAELVQPPFSASTASV
jgi:hypothetical protein